MAATSVKQHLRIAATIMLATSLVMAAMGQAKFFLLLIAIALELYALTEIRVDWSKKYHIKGMLPLVTQRQRNSVTGAIAQLAAIVCLAGAFLSP
jgi:hypothetical protein